MRRVANRYGLVGLGVAVFTAVVVWLAGPASKGSLPEESVETIDRRWARVVDRATLPASCTHDAALLEQAVEMAERDWGRLAPLVFDDESGIVLPMAAGATPDEVTQILDRLAAWHGADGGLRTAGADADFGDQALGYVKLSRIALATWIGGREDGLRLVFGLVSRLFECGRMVEAMTATAMIRQVNELMAEHGLAIALLTEAPAPEDDVMQAVLAREVVFWYDALDQSLQTDSWSPPLIDQELLLLRQALGRRIEAVYDGPSDAATMADTLDAIDAEQGAPSSFSGIMTDRLPSYVRQFAEHVGAYRRLRAAGESARE